MFVVFFWRDVDGFGLVIGIMGLLSFFWGVFCFVGYLSICRAFGRYRDYRE